jgi:hypothetical protein
MARARPRRLVIDACIAQAAGDIEATHPTSRNCRDFLRGVDETGHHLLMTPAIWEEWEKPRAGPGSPKRLSKYASAFRNKMFASRRLIRQDVPANPAFRGRLAKAAGPGMFAKVLEKDCHLIEAALAADRIVVSIEVSCREQFRAVAHAVKELPRVGWVDPVEETETVLAWLQDGAKLQSCRKLTPISRDGIDI